MGTHTEITQIVVGTPAPEPGDTVWVSVMVKNKNPAAITIRCIAAVNWGALTGDVFIDLSGVVGAGIIATFSGYFIMPTGVVIIRTYTYYLGTDGVYHLDDDYAADIQGQPIGEPIEEPVDGEPGFLELEVTKCLRA